MKDVIYLEPDEEITSIIDKLKDITCKKVILVAPKGASIIKSVVNLKILKKEGESLGLEIAFVTNDLIGRNIIAQIGLPIYENIDSLKPVIKPKKEEPDINETIEIDMSEKKPNTPPPGVQVHYYNQNDEDENINKAKTIKKKKEPITHTMASPMSAKNYHEPIAIKPIKPKKFPIKVLIIILILVLGYFSFMYFYVKSTINLIVKSEKIEENIQITVDTSLSKPSEDNKSIPGEIVSIKDEITKEFKATGKKDIGEKAKGKITISNGTGTVLEIPAVTQFETNNKLIYLSVSSVSVPAATASVDAEGNVIKTPGKSEVLVESREAGDKYNIEPTTFAIANFPNATASNQEKFYGGVTKEITIISSNDFDNAYEELKNQLEKKASENLLTSVQDKKLSMLSDAISYENLDFISDKKEGTETDKFNATLKLEAKTIAFSEDNYKNNVLASLGSKIPQDKELVISKDDQIAQGDFNIDLAKGVLKIDGVISTKLAPKLDYDAIKKDIKGKKIDDAISYLKTNTSFKDVVIENKPNWYKKIAKKISNITLDKNYQNQ